MQPKAERITASLRDSFLIPADLLADPVIEVDQSGIIRAANPAAAELFGKPGTGSGIRQLIGTNLSEHLVSDQEAIGHLLERYSRSAQLLPGVLCLPDGEDTHVEYRCDGAALEPDRVLIIFRKKAESVNRFVLLTERIDELSREISLRLRAEKQIAAEREWFRTTLTSIGDAVIAVDKQGNIIFINPVAERLTGWPTEDAFGKPLEEVFAIFHEDTLEPQENPIVRVLRDCVTVGLGSHTVLIGRDGKKRALDDSGAPIVDSDGNLMGAVLIFRDVTEQRRSEEQMRQTQKLESLGVLAGGIAHDFNNLLTGIMGNASLALDILNRESPARDMLEDLITASERAALLTRQLLAYAGKAKIVVEPIDLAALVREITTLLRVSISKTVQLRLDLPEGLPRIDADAGQLQQLVMNLVINAAEAIGEDGSGTVVVTCGYQEVDSHYLRSVFEAGHLQPGPYVTLEISDSGCGMSSETVSRIFDPFFTTKFAGRGLGLSAVLGIVRSHKGALKVYSQIGKGSTFRVLFPVSATQAGVVSSDPAESAEPVSGTVLVVDDEDTVRKVASGLLKRLGYSVVTARNGVEALRVINEKHAELSCILLDLTMPVMSGDEVMRRVQAQYPKLPILLSSGYTESEATRKFAGKQHVGFLQKPYTVQQLTAALRRAIAEDAEWG